MDKVGVYIQLFGETETTAKIKELKAQLEKLEKDKTNISINSTAAQAQVKELTASINQIKLKIENINKLTIQPKAKFSQLSRLNKELEQTTALLNNAKTQSSVYSANAARNTANIVATKANLAKTTESMFTEAEQEMVKEGVNAYRTTQDEVAREINSAAQSSKNYDAQYAAACAARQQAHRTDYQNWWKEQTDAQEEAANKTKQLQKEQEQAQKQNTQVTKQQLEEQAQAYQNYYRQLSNIGTAIRNIGQSLRSFGMTGSMYVTLPTVTAGVSSVNAYADYDYNLRKISTILEAEGQLGDETMTELAEQVRAMSETHATTQSEILSAMYEAISAGVPGSQSAEFVEVANELAKAGFSGNETTTDLLTSIVNAYDDFNYDKDTLYSISDMLLQTQNYGKIIVDQMASVLPQVIPIGNTYGVGFQDILSGLITLTKQGITPSSAGTYMTQLMTQLGKTTGSAGTLFKEAAGESFTEYMKTHKLNEALKLFQSAVDAKGEEVGNYLTNKRALAGFSALMNQMEDFETQQGNIADAAKQGGAVTSASYQEIRESLAEEINQIKTNLNTLGTTIGSILAPKVLSGISKLQSFIDTFNSWDLEKQEKFLSRIAKVAIAFPLTWLTGATLSSIGTIIKAFAFLGKNFGLGAGGGLLLGSASKNVTNATATAGQLVTFGTRLKSIGTAFVGASAFVGVVAEIGAVIYEYGKVIEAISNLDIGENYSSNIQRTLAVAGTMAAFGGGLTALFTALPKATQIKALIGEGLTAGYIADIALIGEVVKEYAGVVQTIADVDLGGDYDANVSKVGGMFAVMSAFTGGLTAIGGFAGLPMAIGELLTAGFIGDLHLLTQVANEIVDTTQNINDADINTKKLEKNVKAMSSAMGSIGAMLVSDGYNTITNLGSDIAGHANIRALPETIEPLLSTLEAIGETEIPSTTKLDKLGDAIESLSDTVLDTGGDGFWESLGTYFETLADNGTLNGVKNGVNNITTILGSVKDMVASLSDAETALNNYGGSAKISESMGSIISMLGDTLNTLSNGELGDLMAFFDDTSEGIGLMGENFMLSNIGKAISTITNVLDAVSEVQSKLNGISTYAMQGIDAKGNKTGNSFSERIGAIMYEVKSALDAVAGENAGFGEQITSGLTNKALTFNESTYAKAMDTIGTVLDSVVALQNKLNSISTYAIQGVDANGNSSGFSLSERVGAIIGQVKDILSLVGGDNDNALTAGWEALAKKFDSIKIDELKAAFEKIGELITTVTEMQTTLNSTGLEDSEGINELFNNLRTVLTNISTLGANIPFDTSDIGNWTNRADVAEQMSLMFDQLKDMLVKLKAMESLIGEMEVGEDGGYTVVTKIQNLMNGITGAFAGLSTDSGSASLEAITSLAQAINMLMDAMQSFSSASEKTTTTTTNLSTSFQTAQTDAGNLSTSLDTLSAAAGSGALALNGMTSSASSMISAFQSAAAAANALISAINSIPDSKTVSVSTTGSVKGLTKATKRAIGGTIFRKSGTDTVPAMLTPGEFVIRKSSAQLLGNNVLNRLNHSDLTGAMMALSNKVGLGGYSVNNTKNYNNNAQVTQNITTNNPNYSYRRARRWAMAL